MTEAAASWKAVAKSGSAWGAFAGGEVWAGAFVRDGFADVEVPFFEGEVAADEGAEVVGGGAPEGPDVDGFVRPSRGEARAVWGEGYRCNLFLMTGEGERRSIGLAEGPEADGAVVAGRGEAGAVRGKSDGVNLVLMAGENQRRGIGLAEVPEADGVVVAGRGETRAVWIADSFSAAAITRNWFMLVPSAAAIRSTAAFSEMGKRKENVDTLGVISLSPVMLPPASKGEFQIAGAHLYSRHGYT